MYYEHVLCLLGCGGDFSVTETDVCMGTPGFPNQYMNNLMCSWKITAPEGKLVSCRFKDFSLEQSDTLTLGKLTSPIKDVLYCGQLWV